jgi:hypothetical protein
MYRYLNIKILGFLMLNHGKVCENEVYLKIGVASIPCFFAEVQAAPLLFQTPFFNPNLLRFPPIEAFLKFNKKKFV